MNPSETLTAITTELSQCLAKVRGETIESALDQLSNADRIFLAGAGRSGLAIKAFAMRLMHMGKTAHVIAETTTPGIRPGDLLVIGSGSGTTTSLYGMAQKAKQVGAPILLVTIVPQSSLGELADCLIQIPASSPKAKSQTPLSQSIQPMGSLFEQCLLLLLDAMILLLMDKEHLRSEDMFVNHANLE